MAPVSSGLAFDVEPLQFTIDTSARGALVRRVEHCDVNMLRPANGTVVAEKVGELMRFFQLKLRFVLNAHHI